MLVLAAAALLAACGPGPSVLPPGSPFPAETAVEYGAAVGDVTHGSALLWVRTVDAARLVVQWRPESAVGRPADAGRGTLSTHAGRDFTGTLLIEGLRPDTEYRYEVRPAGQPDGGAVSGVFRTAPAPDAETAVRFVWGADVGGQHHCRQGAAGYPIFDAMRAVRPAFAVLLGDLIYADGTCPSPPNAPGAEFIARTLEEYRAKHRYQRGAAALQRFLAEVPVHVVWDDHEVRNNFSGPVEPLMPIGRQAFFEYWPIRSDPTEPGRLYRRFTYGRTLELFLLDTRQYRDRNAAPDGPGKTMLGERQRDWLVAGLTNSRAIWKVVATSVPLSIPKGGTLRFPGNDSWAPANDGTGFGSELRRILEAVRAAGVDNLVWLAADVHFPQAHAYDLDRDGEADFYEFIAGPLSARPADPVAPVPVLNPVTLYSDGGFANFGTIAVDPRALQVEIVDEHGQVRFRHRLFAR